MSPFEKWNQLATPDRLDLPVDPDELEIVCSDSFHRVISNEGIEWHSTMFQSPALQELRRRLPSAVGGTVTVRNSGHMARIWVYDPTDDSHLEVLNTDPDTKDLTVKQVRELNAVRGPVDSPGRLSAAEARRRLRDYQRQLVECKNTRAKKALMRLLGLLKVDPVPDAETQAPAPHSKHKAKDAKPAAQDDQSPRKPRPAKAPAATKNGGDQGPQQRHANGDRPVPVFKRKHTQNAHPNPGHNS